MNVVIAAMPLVRSDVRTCMALCTAVSVVLIAACVPSPRTHTAAPLDPGLRIALLPLANYTQSREAPDKIAPMLLSELGQRGGIHIADPGAVEAVLSRDPWLLFDRIPPDLIDRFGRELGVDALLVGSVLGYGYRQANGERVPHVAIALRLVRTPGGVVLWSSVHSRDGDDNEWLFGFGRIQSLEQLLVRSVAEITRTFPATQALAPPPSGRDSASRDGAHLTDPRFDDALRERCLLAIAKCETGRGSSGRRNGRAAARRSRARACVTLRITGRDSSDC